MSHLPGRTARRAFDALALAALALYIIAGAPAVPFHGDEATLIFMSRDYAYLVQQRDLDRVRYRDPSPWPAEQELRLVNGTVGKMAMGLAWDVAGLTVDELNGPWDWGADWAWNVSAGHQPADRLLDAARLSSALLLVIGAWAVYGIGALAGPGRIAGAAAGLIFATTPAVLLNGRRAMMEGAHLGCSAPVMLVVLLLIRAQRQPAPRRAALIGWAAALGVLSGCAVASKHTAVSVAAAAFGAALIEPLIRRGAGGSRFDAGHVGRLSGAGALALITFLALNPAWWSDPVGMPGRVLDLRRALLDGQVAAYGGYDGWPERIEGLADQAFFAGPQFYEVPAWAGYIGAEIDAYRGSILAGRGGGRVWGVLLAALSLGGLAILVRRGRAGAWAVLIWAAFSAGAVLLTPLPWQRYYLPLYAPLAVLAGVGAGECWRWGAARVKSWRSPSGPPGTAKE